MPKILRQDIELLRIVSALGIVCFHATGNEFAYASLIIFIVISMFLAGVGKRAVTVDLVQKRFGRLMTPWATWFVVYGAINLIKHQSFFPIDNGVAAGILSGSRIHLWYMPFILGCLLLFDVIKNNFSSTSISIASPILASSILFLAPVWSQFATELGPPLAQYSHALAAVLIGVYLSHFYVLRRSLSLLLLALIVISSLAAFPIKGVGVTYLVAIVFCLVLLSKCSQRFGLVDFSPISQCMLGVYLLHVIVLSAVSKLAHWAGLFIPVIAFIVSTLAVYVARRMFPKLAGYWS